MKIRATKLTAIASAIQKLLGTFTPQSLFTSGVNGAWYDPSDFSTMFQNAAGTVPVTAVGQPVGLMLDKSKGLELGPELVTNGTFDTGISGWDSSFSTAPSTVVWNSGQAVFQTDGVNSARLRQSITVVIGKTYRVSRSGNARLFLGTSAGGNQYGQFTSSGSQFITATSTSLWLNYVDIINGAYEDNISVRELPGNHAFNPSGNSANYPVLQQDGTGRYYLAFNGVNQWLQTNSIDFTYGDKMFVSAGVRKLDTTAKIIAEISANASANNGAFNVFQNGTAIDEWYLSFRGTASQVVKKSGYASPITNIVSGISDISAPSATLRINASQVAQSTASQGTGTYGNYAMYLGARAGTSLFFNGRLYGLVVAGKAASASEIASTEAWLNSKTGAY